MFSEHVEKVVAEQFRLKVPKGRFGIEIETEGEGLPEGKVTGDFTGKVDGSLRQGMEYVSKVLSDKDVHLAVENLRWKLEKDGARINPSYRSSTHIHVNYADKTFKDVLGSMVIWAMAEPIAFRLLPPGRDGSLFCVPSYDTGELADFTDRFCQDIGRSFYNGFNPRGKYSSLNITRLGTNHDDVGLGTLEYRIFPTSLDGAQITQWCTWLGNIQDFAVQAGKEDRSFLSCVRNAEQKPQEFIERIFGNVRLHDAGQLVDFGARTGFEMARMISKNLKEKAPEKKPSKKIQGMHADVAIMDDAFNMPALEVDHVGIQGAEVAPVMAAGNFPRRRGGLAAPLAGGGAEGVGAAVRPRRGLGRRRAQPVPVAPEVIDWRPIPEDWGV